MCIFDIQYKNNEYITYIDQSRHDKSEFTYEIPDYYYTTFSKLIFDSSQDAEGYEHKSLILSNDFGENWTVVGYYD